jgi:hypothetical protein
MEVARNLDGVIGRSGMERAGVVGRGDGDGLDPEGAAGPEDPERDLAPVRHEETLDRHGCTLVAVRLREAGTDVERVL